MCRHIVSSPSSGRRSQPHHSSSPFLVAAIPRRHRRSSSSPFVVAVPRRRRSSSPLFLVTAEPRRRRASSSLFTFVASQPAGSNLPCACHDGRHGTRRMSGAGRTAVSAAWCSASLLCYVMLCGVVPRQKVSRRVGVRAPAFARATTGSRGTRNALGSTSGALQRPHATSSHLRPLGCTLDAPRGPTISTFVAK